jgi:hypothetical protein
MDATAGQFRASVGLAISVEVAAPPTADVIILPTDDAGTPGDLNSEILEQLCLPKKLPQAADVRKGYHIERSSRGLLCYVVTVTNIPTSVALRTYLSAALADPLLASVRSIWIPLMGTVAGGMPFSQSFAITLGVLRSSTMIAKGSATVVISLPPSTLLDMGGALMEAIRKASAEVELALPKAAPLNADPYKLARSDAVTGALDHASNLARLHREQHDVISTTLLFFALAESQAAGAPAVLRDDIASGFFSSAVHFLAADRYPVTWRTYFGTEEQLPSSELQPTLLRPTENVTTVLQNAHMLAGGDEKRSRSTIW